MELIRAAADLTRGRRAQRRSAGADVGLVPTMGALHDGHASLIRRARAERDRVVVSIFVNPLQFATGRGPRRAIRATRQRDVGLARSARRRRRLGAARRGGLSAGRRARRRPTRARSATSSRAPSRPGHFAGVLTVVHRLFDVVGPSAAYFGEKDAQQLFLVRRMVEQLGAAGRDRRVSHRPRARRAGALVAQRLPLARGARTGRLPVPRALRGGGARASGRAGRRRCWSRRWRARWARRRSRRSTTPPSSTRRRSNRRDAIDARPPARSSRRAVPVGPR